MIPITVEGLVKRFGATVALKGIDLRVEPGELFFLLGPSGCGKTTLLRCLAGFSEPDAGRILFGDDDVTRRPAHRRETGMVFQSYALWPHLTVAENVAFGLEERRVPAAEVRRRTAEALEAVQLGALAGRRPNQLSGGQQQRVALARALVVRPRCLLLDEPLSNLDAKLRLEMRGEIRRVCKDNRLTTVYVTHDQKEALSMADRMAVMEAGAVSQLGTPREVYRRPATRAVAGFIGETNFLAGRLLGPGGHGAEGRVVVETAAGRFTGAAGPGVAALAAGAAVTLSVRPECWRLLDDDGTVPVAGNAVRGEVADEVYLGEVARFTMGTAAGPLQIFELNPRHAGAAAGRTWRAVAEPDDVVVLAS